MSDKWPIASRAASIARATTSGQEIHESVVECPLSDIVAEQKPEGEVGWLAGLQCRRYRPAMLRLWLEDQLDLFAGVLLEGGDDLLDRLTLLGVVALIPPYG
jgi:hypothetical protein